MLTDKDNTMKTTILELCGQNTQLAVAWNLKK